MRKNISGILFFVLITAVFSASTVHAVAVSNPGKSMRSDLKEISDDVKNLRDSKKDIREDIKELISSKAGVVKNLLRSKASISSGKLTDINGTTLSIEKDGKTYTVLTGQFSKCATQFKRHYWGNSAISEMTVGDLLNIQGRWQDDSRTILEACLVRDISIQKRNGVFIGEVLSVNGTGWIMSTVSNSRTNQTVVISSKTKLVNRKQQSIAQTDVVVGHRVRVIGLWNKTTNTVTEVVQVKDFTLPIVSTPRPTP